MRYVRDPARLMGAILLVCACRNNSVAQGSSPAHPPVSPVSPAVAVAEDGPDARGVLRDAFTSVSRDTQGAIVNISTEQHAQPAPAADSRLEDFFERFFGGPVPPPPQRPQRSLGSGVIVDSDGYIVTNHHVVAGADSIEVQLANDDTYEAELVGSDPSTDLAVVKVDAEKAAPLPVVPLGDSDELEIGQWVLAMGNPFGLGSTVTAGIVSATGRVIGQGPYDDFIQTDAAINPGNSGGPLLNLKGEVVGINSAIFSRTGGNLGIGFAIPSNLAADVYEEIVRTGKVARGWLGVTIQDLTPELAEGFGIEASEGAVVSDVGEGTPAAEAGLAPGDVIVSLNGTPVTSSANLVRRIGSLEPGERVELELFREGDRESIEIVLGDRAESVALAPAPGGEPGAEASPGARMGATLESLTDELASRLSVTSSRGVVVTALDPSGAAARAGLRVGDVVLEVDREPVESSADLTRRIRDIPAGESVLLRVERAGGFFFATVTLDESNRSSR